MGLNLKSLLGAAGDAVPTWVVNSFPVIKLVIMCLILASSIAMIVLVILQKGNTNGVTGITGDSSDTFYNRNKKHSADSIIKNITIIVSVVILVLSLTYVVLNSIYAGGLA